MVTLPSLFFFRSILFSFSANQNQLVYQSISQPINQSVILFNWLIKSSLTYWFSFQDHIVGAYWSIPSHTIKGHSVRKLSTTSDITCVLLCQRTSICKSVTYLPMSQSLGLCTLHKTNMRETPGSFEARRHVIYFELITWKNVKETHPNKEASNIYKAQSPWQWLSWQRGI
jgi:hypothetical protein